MPKLSSIVDNTEHSWGDFYKKDQLEGFVFWIHDARVTTIEDPARGPVSLLICNLTLQSEDGEHGVISLGDSDSRAQLREYFMRSDAKGERLEPLGPCRLVKTETKAGYPFWRVEDAE